jgi:glycogen debranching enzyme
MRLDSPGLHERLQALLPKANAGLAELKIELDLDGRTLQLYQAGQQGTSVRFGLFGRDLLTSAWMLADPEFTESVIRFVCGTLGERTDARTGEEPGRGIHEYDEVSLRGLSTRYAASEVSLLLLTVAADHHRATGDTALVRALRDPLLRAGDYVYAHLEDGVFTEDPHRCGASRYALRATYWKDSQLPGRVDPRYPVVYGLVQAQAVAGLRGLAVLLRLLDEPEKATAAALTAKTAARRLFTALWDEATGVPLIAQDHHGPIAGVSSDALHLLAYLEPGDVPGERLAAIEEAVASLETPYGYRTYAAGQPDYAPTAYHLGGIWPFEQAFIARGARLHGLDHVTQVAAQTVAALERLGFVELCYWTPEDGLSGPGTVPGEGCDLQLWSVAVPPALLALEGEGGLE